ncbi:hypothetical protein Pfo_026755 [Paulownia fortunei]|nr:hypothetical protein Pfo_026755 [Paulownia fortunei]
MENAERDGSSSMDRISQLPQVILQHILYFLSQKEAAKTSVLSKAWRYIWSTRPNFEFRENCTNGTKEVFLSLLNKTLQGYHDQKLCIEEFRVWIIHMGVKKFHLYILPKKDFSEDNLKLPYIESMQVENCEGLRTIRVNKLHNLRHFTFSEKYRERNSSIVIKDSANWFHDHKFPNLKSLSLNWVQLSSKWFDNFSCNFPSLQQLFLLRKKKTIKAAIDAPNISYFEFSGDLPQSISFTRTSIEWASNISLSFLLGLDDASSWFFKLNELLKALSRSKISLDIFELPMNQHIEDLLLLDDGGDLYKPVVVEHLYLSGHSSNFSAFLNGLFRICHPRNIGHLYCCANVHSEWERERKELTEFLCKILMGRENRNKEFRPFWQQDLEEVSMETYDVSSRRMVSCPWENFVRMRIANQLIGLRLKWRYA